MTRSTPEGARDYLVPSRVHPGHFYALPQSPQIFKQILMISGFDRYFQIARCFRDEDLRADRQPEFTQIDLEMSFPQMSTIFAVAEGFLNAAFSAAGIALPAALRPHDLRRGHPANYGIDKPDMRLPAMVDLSDELTPELRDTLKIEQRCPSSASSSPSVGELSGTAPQALVSEIRASFGDCGLDFLDVARLKTNEAFAPLADSHRRQALRRTERIDCESLESRNSTRRRPRHRHHPQARHTRASGTTIRSGSTSASALSASNSPRSSPTSTSASSRPAPTPTSNSSGSPTSPCTSGTRRHKTWDAAHHPFTSPHEEDIKSGRLINDKGAVRALAYDIVLNGTELGSGSIRIHRQDVQAEIFRSLGMTDEEAKARFGFFLDALEYGTPPHGGIALGLDRIVMILAGATSLREVIAFPKTAKAIDLMVDAPTPVSDTQLRDLHLRTVTRS